MPELFRIEYHSGRPVEHHGRTLIPFNRVVSLQPGGRSFGAIWNKPSSLFVRQPDGSEQILPIPDPTLHYILAILVVGLLTGLLVRWMVSKRLGS
jgi:hypothetical protein